jgi:VanZ family protein
MALIFFASTDAGSASQSGQLIERLLTWLGLWQRLSPEEFEALHYAIRKAGHVAEYALLAVLLHRAMGRGRRRWALPVVAGVMAAAGGYAATDELHQRFVASRGGSGWDVLLDSVGAALGLAVKWVLEGGWRRSSGNDG